MQNRIPRLRLALPLVPCLALSFAWAQAEAPVQELEPRKTVAPETVPPGAQDEEAAPEKKPFELPPLPGGAGGDPQQEIIKAFQKVERELENMSLLLLEASRGDTSRLLNAKDSGIEELLQLADKRPQGETTSALAELLYASSGGGERVLQGIDEIIELAQQNGDSNSVQSSSSSSQQQQQKQQQGQSQGQQQQQQSGQRQMQGQEKPGGEQQSQEPQNGEDPRSNRQSEEDPNQAKSKGENAPDPDEVGAERNVLPGRESWGNLPIHVRDIFRADGSADMPARYRTWIDSYYRKLNRENQR